MLHFPLSELMWLALAVIAAGLFTGILAGLFGVGGGAVIVPALYEVFQVLDVPADVRMQLCIGSSRPSSCLRRFAPTLRTAPWGWSFLRLCGCGPPAVLGVIVGSLVSAWAPGRLFKIAFVIFAAFVSAWMLVGRNWSLGVSLPGRAAQRGLGFLTGLVSSLVGVSGGSISNAALTLYGIPMHQAVATSAGIGCLSPSSEPLATFWPDGALCRCCRAISWLRIFDRPGARGATINHSRTAWRPDGASAAEVAT
jgi:uncharacterized protein